MNSTNDYKIQVVISRNLLLFLLSVLLPLFILTWLSPYVFDVFVIIGITIFLAISLEPLATHLESRNIGRTTAILMVLLVANGIALILGALLIPVFSTQIHNLSLQFSIENAQTLISQLNAELSFIPQSNSIALIIEQAVYFMAYLFHQSERAIPDFITSRMLYIITPIATFFILKDGYQLKKQMLKLLPNRYFEMMLNLLYQIDQLINQFLKIQILNLLIIGALATLAFFLLGISNFLVLGIIVGFSFAIPYYGPVIGASVAIIFMFPETGVSYKIIAIIIGIATMKLVHNSLLSMQLMNSQLQLHPLLTILFLLIGTLIGGFIGLLTAIPMCSMLILIGKAVHWSLTSYRLS